MKDDKELVEKILASNQVKSAFFKMHLMSNSGLQSLVMIACNQIGHFLNNNKEYSSSDEACLLIDKAVTMVFTAYEKACTPPTKNE